MICNNKSHGQTMTLFKTRSLLYRRLHDDISFPAFESKEAVGYWAFGIRAMESKNCTLYIQCTLYQVRCGRLHIAHVEWADKVLRAPPHPMLLSSPRFPGYTYLFIVFDLNLITKPLSYFCLDQAFPVAARMMLHSSTRPRLARPCKYAIYESQQHPDPCRQCLSWERR